MRTVATQLAQERALKVGAAIWVLAVMTLVLFRIVAALWLDSAEDDVSGFGLSMYLAIALLVLAPILVLTALRAAWVAQRAMNYAVREELNVRALSTDPQSAYGLPGFPDMSAGSGDLSETDGGGLTEVSSDKARTDE